MVKYLLRYIVLFCLWLAMLSSCRQNTYHIGVSQCYHNDWNLQLDRDIRREANSHPEIKLDIRLTHDGVEGQIKDLREMIVRKVDVILVAPEVAAAISPIIDEAVAAHIPVILIDSETSNSDFTAMVCVDNEDIGKKAAQFAGRNLGGRGKVISVMGVRGSSNTDDRHDGFVEGLREYPDIHVVDSCYTDWTYEVAYPLIDSLLEIHPDIDLIACQNDPTAIASYDACIKHQLAKMPIILGVDALLGDGNGIQSLLDGKITATCTNPTGSFEAIHLALDILEGRPYERITMLQTQLIDQGNVKLVMQLQQLITQQNNRIEEVNSALGQYFERSRLWQMLVVVSVLLILLTLGFAAFIKWNANQKALLRQKVEESTLAKLTFFANVSHSFRTPLSLIADPIRSLLSEGGLSNRQTEMLQLMQQNTDELQKLLGKVLNVLQDDLLKDGERLDAVAQQSAQGTITPTQMRTRTFGTHPAIVANENQKTILVIDDNPDMRKYLGMILSQQNYLVLTAPNGEEGLLVAKQNIPDAIICDVMMPVMDGLECCRLLKADINTSHIPVMMLTAYALDDQRIQGYESGADAYITKPFNSQVLCARIANLIDSRKQINASKDRYSEVIRAEFSSVDRNLINHFHSFVTENLSNLDLDIPQLCEEFGMSRVQLYRKCKSISGQSPVELVRTIRLKAATAMLESTDKPISQIAYETGFSSPSYFAKCYKDQYGESPTDVQKRAAEKQGV